MTRPNLALAVILIGAATILNSVAIIRLWLTA